MTYELPPSLIRYRAELEAAIGRDLHRRRGRDLRWLSRLPIRITSVAVVGVVAVFAVVLLFESGNGGPFVSTAYASFAGAPGAQFNNKIRGYSNNRLQAVITTRSSFSWTNEKMTMTVHWTKHQLHPRRTERQVRSWYASRTTPLPGRFQMALHPIPGVIGPVPGTTVNGEQFSANGGTTKQQGIVTTLRILQPGLNGNHPLKYIQVHTPGRTLTFRITKSTGWRNTATG